MRRRWMFWAPIAVLGLLLFIALGGFVVQQLWNWLLPSLFGWRMITFWQAIGILMLSRILVGGFGMRGSSRHHRRWMAERWETMTPEERERFRQGMRGRCGFGPPESESKGASPV